MSAIPTYGPSVNVTGASLVSSSDEWTRAEWAAVITGGGAFTFDLCALVVLNWNRDVPYIKILSLAFINLAFASFALYWFSSATAVRLIPQVGIFVGDLCALWNMWLYFLSIAMLLTALIARMWRFYIVLILRRRASGVSWMLMPAALWSIGIVYTAVGTGLHLDGPVQLNDDPGTVICYLNDALLYVHIAHIAVLAVVYLFLLVRLRLEYNRIWNEYLSSIICFVAFVVGLVVIGGLIIFNFHFQPWGRATVSLVLTGACNIGLWSLIGSSFINVLFRHEQALEEFDQLVRRKSILVNVSSTSSFRRLSPFAWFTPNHRTASGSHSAGAAAEAAAVSSGQDRSGRGRAGDTNDIRSHMQESGSLVDLAVVGMPSQGSSLIEYAALAGSTATTPRGSTTVLVGAVPSSKPVDARLALLRSESFSAPTPESTQRGSSTRSSVSSYAGDSVVV